MDRIHRMSRGRKTLLSLLLVGTIGTVAGIGTFSAFSATTVNAGNVFAAGTVSISDNDAGAAMYICKRDGKGGYKLDAKALDSFGRASPEVTNAYITWSLTEAKVTDIDEELDALAAKGSLTPELKVLRRDLAAATPAVAASVPTPVAADPAASRPAPAGPGTKGGNV